MIKNKAVQTDLTTKDFRFDLPERLIAQKPREDRSASRMLTLDRASGEVKHRNFLDIIDVLRPGDVMVINDSKVIPARLYGKTPDDKDVEMLLLRQREIDEWEVLTRPGKRAKPGQRLTFGGGRLTAEIIEAVEDGNRIARLKYDTKDTLMGLLDEIGIMPLPPYITEKLGDKNRYQTVYARQDGSVAAPTAGLHFTAQTIEALEKKGVIIAPVMLHVGLGTFRPVKTEKIEDHIMHSEFFSITKESADKINRAKMDGGRILAVGTTSCRVLESAADENGTLQPMTADTGIFIYPGYKFKAVDMLLTNFHLPESTLLMLISAFSSREYVLEAYSKAIENEYRFFSFGDCMLLH